MTIRKLVRGDARTVSQQLRGAIAGLYDAWWDKRAPGRTRFERAAATAARNRAMTGDGRAPPPPSTTTGSTSPATSPSTAGNPPPAPAPPPTSTRPTPAGKGTAHGRRPALDLGLHPRSPRRPGTPRLPPQRQRAHRPGHRAHPPGGPDLRGHPGRSPGRLRRGAVLPADGTQPPSPPGQDAVIVSAARSRPCWPRWTTPPNTSGTGPRRAPTAPASPAPPASGACRPPIPTTRWPAARSTPPRPPPPQRAPGHPAPPGTGPHAAAGKEAGQ